MSSADAAAAAAEKNKDTMSYSKAFDGKNNDLMPLTSESPAEKNDTASFSEPAAEKNNGTMPYSEPAAEKKMLVLRSSDHETFEVEEKVAVVSVALKNLVDDDCVSDPFIPIPNVPASILKKVIEYCKRHVEATEKAKASGDGVQKVVDEDLKKFDAEFVNVDWEMLFEMILAANYLNIKELLDLTCQAVADKIKDKTPEDVRKIFNIVNDFTPEEEQKIRDENPWAYE